METYSGLQPFLPIGNKPYKGIKRCMDQSELSQVAYFKDNILKIFLLMESPTGSKWRM